MTKFEDNLPLLALAILLALLLAVLALACRAQPVIECIQLRPNWTNGTWETARAELQWRVPTGHLYTVEWLGANGTQQITPVFFDGVRGLTFTLHRTNRNGFVYGERGFFRLREVR